MVMHRLGLHLESNPNDRRSHNLWFTRIVVLPLGHGCFSVLDGIV